MLHMEAEVERKLMQMSLLSKENQQLKLKHQVRLQLSVMRRQKFGFEQGVVACRA
jgi:hypothetical protein